LFFTEQPKYGLPIFVIADSAYETNFISKGFQMISEVERCPTYSLIVGELVEKYFTHCHYHGY
jgi:hypothetical protein